MSSPPPFPGSGIYDALWRVWRGTFSGCSVSASARSWILASFPVWSGIFSNGTRSFVCWSFGGSQMVVGGFFGFWVFGGETLGN